MDGLRIFQQTLEVEAQSILKAKESLESTEVEKLIQLYRQVTELGGQIVFCGVGKSGIIGQKLASTFCSLGAASFFLHPNEALHGDLGRLRRQDALVMISKSGNTEELLRLLPYVDLPKEHLVGLIGKVNSKLWDMCHIRFDCSVEKEASVNNLAPTTSSTVALAMGDAMAVTYESFAQVSKESFALNHPGGLLGKSLSLKVSDLMTPQKNCGKLSPEDHLKDALLAMTTFNVGGCVILDSEQKLQGLLVEGDIRRALSEGKIDLEKKITDIMNSNPISCGPDILALEALRIMQSPKRQIDVLPVVSETKEFLGILRLHDLWQEGLLPSKEI